MIVIIKLKKTLKYCVKSTNEHCLELDIKRQVKELDKVYGNDAKVFLVTAVLLFSRTDLHGPRCFYFLHSRFFFFPSETSDHTLSLLFLFWYSSVEPLQWNFPGRSPRRKCLCISAEKCEDLFFTKPLSPLRHDQKLIKLLLAAFCERIHSRNGQRENHITLNTNNNFFFLSVV